MGKHRTQSFSETLARYWRGALPVFAVLVCFLTTNLANAQSDAPLFSFVNAAAVPTSFDLNVAAIEPNLSLVEGAATSFTIALASGESYTAILGEVERRGLRDVTWRGSLKAFPSYRVVLTQKDDQLLGRISTPTAIYIVEPTGAQHHVLRELNTRAFPPDGEPLPIGSATDGSSRKAQPLLRGGDNVIDVMVLYSPQARAGAGGQNQIELIAQAAVDNTNTAFIDSDMTARFNLVHTAETERDEVGEGFSEDLNWVRNSSAVNDLRNEMRADMVGLIVNSGDFCGRGVVMRSPSVNFEGSAFQVTRRSCAVGNLTYAHEHGHNMGFEHDPENGTNPGNASFPWSFGHFNSGSYRTVMSYSSECNGGCSRVAHFSNPDVNHAGQPTGISNERDNARSGDAVNTIVSSFRLRPDCGDGVREDPEQCDGSDLGGEICMAAGCTTGEPVCTSSCTLDFSACGGCCNNDGICNVDETQASCPNDCDATDSDGDGVFDTDDNCTLAANTDQTDSNNDGYGNLCDADLNDDCTVNTVDLGLMRQMFFTDDPDADLNSDGVVNVADLGIMRVLFFNEPGPSGLPTGC